MPTADTFLTPIDLAEMLNVPVATLHRWRYKRSGPPAMKLGRHLRYRREDVERWLVQRGV